LKGYRLLIAPQSFETVIGEDTDHGCLPWLVSTSQRRLSFKNFSKPHFVIFFYIAFE
jgi:hypothetical protein